MSAFDVVIVGGGSAGITVAARLRRSAHHLKIAIIDPAEKHYYQPLFTLVGGGAARFEDAVKPQSEVVPKGVTWLQTGATKFFPEKNIVETADGKTLTYRYLVVCPGMQLNWHQVAGLKEVIGKGGVCSNFAPEYVSSTWDAIRQFKGGTAIFTFPNTPIKCAGAPQKIMYLADDYWRRNGVREKSEVIFVSAGGVIFGVKKYADALDKVVARRGIKTMYKHHLVAVNAERREAVFAHIDTGEKVVKSYDMIHVTPPMSAPDFVRESPLANEAGWVDVNKHTLQHHKYPNIFSLGDASSLPTSKTAAAVRKQAPVIVQNIFARETRSELSGRYDGYTSCPLVTGYGRLILAEFDYEGTPRETFPFDQGKERLSMYLLKKYVLPRLYWNGMLKGLA